MPEKNDKIQKEQFDKKQKWKGNLFLLITACVWGFAFVAQKAASGTGLGTLSFCAFRYLISAVLMLPVVSVAQKKQGRRGINPFDIHSYYGYHEVSDDVLRARRKETLRAGILSGVFLFGGTICQQYALITTTAGKAGFLSTLYVIGVPIASLLVFKNRPGLFSWLGALLALVGLYFLSFAGVAEAGFSSVASGDLLLILGAVFWTGQITTIGHTMEKGADGIRMAQIQYAAGGILSLLGSLFFEHITREALLACLVPILYTSVFSTVIGFTLQIVGQKYTDSTSAALIMSLESVFSCLAGFLVYREMLLGNELLGSFILFTGIILSQLPGKPLRKPKADS